MAISKKLWGNKGNYYEVFKKWIPELEPNNESDILSYDNMMKAAQLYSEQLAKESDSHICRQDGSFCMECEHKNDYCLGEK